MRKIIHVDMDCFYAAVEVKHRPELKGKPVGVGGPPNTRSVLTTANYEARKFGVRSAMPTSRALKLCPNLILVPVNFSLYRKESRAVREIMLRYTDTIEPLSLDEAFLDVTNSPHHGGSATRIAQEIRETIQKELNLTASAGIAPNKFLAKIASDWKKPNGQFVIRPQDITDFMPPLPIEKLYGVGKVTAAKLHNLGFHTCADIQKKSLGELKEIFGSRAEDYYNLARGVDHRIVHNDYERKSLTVEETYNSDLMTVKDWCKRVPELYEDWENRMRRSGDSENIRGFTVKVKFQDFQTMTRERSSTGWPTIKDFEELLHKVWEARPEPVRLLGIGVRLASAKPDVKPPKDENQLSLWDSEIN